MRWPAINLRLPRDMLPAFLCGAATFLQAFDGTALTIALPAMAADLAVAPVTMGLVLSTYLVVGTAVLPFSGWAADRINAKRAFLVAILLFGLSSIACALAADIGQLVAARVMQGIASGLMLPIGRVVALQSVEPRDTARTIAMLATPVTVALVIGPAVGGFIVTWWSWKAIFLLNAPVCLMLLLAIHRYVPHVPSRSRRRLDWRGALLATISITGLTLALSIFPQMISLAAFLALIAFCALVLGYYIATWQRSPQPVLDLSLFRLRTFSAVNASGLFSRSVARGTPFLVTLLLQLGLGLSAAISGTLLMFSAIGALLARPALGPLGARFGFRRVLLLTSLLAALLLAAAGLMTPGVSLTLVAGLMLLQGFFRSIQNVGITTLSFDGIPRERLADASAITTIGQQISGSLGIGLASLCIFAAKAILPAEADVGDAFRWACVTMALISLVALPFLHMLDRDAGSKLV